MKEKIIDIHNITAYSGSTKVFSDLSLKIETGCNTVILGPNGSGKSTLLKLLSCELHPVYNPDSHLRIFGRDRWNVMELRRRLGIVSDDLQRDYLPGAHGINVMLSGFYASIDTWQYQEFSNEEREKAESVMAELGIAALKERPFCAMSTGQQRRFLLGRALVHDPDALLFDEPTAGLDIAASLHYLETVRKLMGSDKTVVLVTHHLHEIPPEIERVVLMKGGRIVGDGKKSDMLTSEALSGVFDYPLQVVAVNGYFQLLPAS
ncbi:ABC transporter ATP-binding protein [Chlorobium ferrooxidans]|uniref:ABC transporter related n=1 Tax=Chlorobium ferrooxidans DSM 13031 TaxID=377431 RepID=Q0YQ39_9CHLB|nr:ATP-binding cassette domain-containing protein [Chlorobium ferrooxidans]EAT58432.1 ABC transporter related [Chlorobium ferrooxidans DSM 13031]